MPMNFADLPMEDQQRVLTMGLQQFRSGAPATKENMNRMREVLMNDAGYAKQIMTDAGVGGYGQTLDEQTAWVSPSQNAYSPDTFLAEDGTDEANGMTSNAPMPPGSRPPIGGMRNGSPANAPIPQRKSELQGGEQAAAEEGAAGGAVDPSQANPAQINVGSDWGSILAQMLGVGTVGLGTAAAIRALPDREIPRQITDTKRLTGPSRVPEGGAEIPETNNTAARPADRSPTEYTEYTEVPREQFTGPESAVEQSIDATLQDEPDRTAETTPDTQDKVSRVRALLLRYDRADTSARQKQAIERSIRELGYPSVREARKTAGLDTPRTGASAVTRFRMP